MGLFDSILGAVAGQAGGQPGAQGGNMLESVIALMNHPDVGGVAGLVEKMSQGGLGNQVASWVSTGANMQVSPDQIQSALSATGLQDVAAKFGLNSADAATQLSALLPQVINHLTPNGQVPQGDVSSQVLAGLGSLFGNKQA